MEYRTIESRVESRFEEKKSVFIGYLAPVSGDGEACAFIEEIKAMHRKARHNCYAYILGDGGARHSDDGEPQGTAGVPIYEVLQKEGLSGVCCVVTRYFGGVLLGAGGLVRAYTKAAADAVSAAKIKVMALAARVEISVDYPLYGRIPKILEEFGAKTADESFGDSVKITAYVREQLGEQLAARLTDACSGNVAIDFQGKEYYNFA